MSHPIPIFLPDPDSCTSKQSGSGRRIGIGKRISSECSQGEGRSPFRFRMTLKSAPALTLMVATSTPGEDSTWLRNYPRVRIPRRRRRTISNASGRPPCATASSTASRSATWAASHRTARIATSIITRPWCSTKSRRSGTPTSSGAGPARRSRASSSSSAAAKRRPAASSPASSIPRTTSAANGSPSPAFVPCKPRRARIAIWCDRWPRAAPACPTRAASRATRGRRSPSRRTPGTRRKPSLPARAPRRSTNRRSP